jgi:hypothetical protein
MRMEICTARKSVGAVRRGIPSPCDVVRPDPDVYVHIKPREGIMVSIWAAIAMLFVGFVMGFFCVACFAVAEYHKKEGRNDSNV